MKRLMFVAVATAAMVGLAEISSNIVGYAHNGNEGQHCPILGPQFFTVSGGETFKLQDLAIPGSRTWENGEWALDFISPENEYIRQFGTDSVGQIEAYTYISENTLIEILEQWDNPNPDVSAKAWAIGWWKYRSGVMYADEILGGDDSEYKVKEDVTFPNGTGFVGSFLNDHEIKIQTQGSVAIETFGFENDGTHCPIFVNQLPVDITLQDMAIPGSRTWQNGEWALDFISPENEFIREFGTDSVGQVEAYTYISENTLIEILEQWDNPNPDVSSKAWAIGWWKYRSGVMYADEILGGDDSEYKVKTPVTVKAGRGFVGSFLNDHNVRITFPSALAVPSKQQD